ncbi:50S ribosomal protein L9 [Aquisalinus flavus]|uniref:Large ribosomal subunit protein bL9 n=1 Tax=Aquisalinus flavus TaxID=1526572 RepID=A0A8J2V2J0_9PROT|nr:50S ribosomal protein L9 [Aquisalinus flavus]MBD0427430.1 50S ribosomal protein L9 [Aquisalinus flavus]UNE47233.1 50S ribosomal protein L9 [Aquisalinus flavus]GGD00963.1 50S ribosomal protein L9 [Aquisalinus flavus]
MEVILLERVENLGGIGDTVSVKAGFARNFLLPRGKALRATVKNQKMFEAQRADIEARNEEAKKAAAGEAGKLNGTSYVLIRQASDMGVLYGSVSSRDISAAIGEAGFNVSRNQVVLDKPLKALGVTDIRVFLHPEVSVTVSINIARSQEEAEAQARGENVLARTDDEIEEAAGNAAVDNEILSDQSVSPEELLEPGMTTAADAVDSDAGEDEKDA